MLLLAQEKILAHVTRQTPALRPRCRLGCTDTPRVHLAALLRRAGMWGCGAGSRVWAWEGVKGGAPGAVTKAKSKTKTNAGFPARLPSQRVGSGRISGGPCVALVAASRGAFPPPSALRGWEVGFILANVCVWGGGF